LNLKKKKNALKTESNGKEAAVPIKENPKNAEVSRENNKKKSMMKKIQLGKINSEKLIKNNFK